MTPTRRKTAAERGLGRDHVVQAKSLKSKHVDGTPCWWCGLPMYRDPVKNWDYKHANPRDPAPGSLAADHSLAREHGGVKADRLLHGLCNKRRQSGAKDHLRPAITGEDPSAAVPGGSGDVLVIACWP